MPASLDDLSNHPNRRNAIAENDAVTSTHLLAVVIKSITSGSTRTATSVLVRSSPPAETFRTQNAIPALNGNNTFTGNNTFEQSVTLGKVVPEPPADGILTITANGTASELTGSSVALPDGNTVELLFNNPGYYWSDTNNFDNQTGGTLAGETAADVAAGLRSWLWEYAFEYLAPPVPAISGDGTDIVITYTRRAAPVGWATSNSTLLPYALTQNGSAGGWSGTPKFLRLFNADNNKLYELKITGTPNPVLTITEVNP